ncbi:hypothetical protein [Delftia tsuruhatensis]|uniref:hypothetical protein n=1 Tax=Delftia tsuruhatensis TaxID=180282 RepID=UPI00370A1D6C
MTATKQQPIAGYRISDPSDPTIKPWLSDTPDDNGYTSEPLYAGAAPAAMAPRVRDLLGIVRTAQAEARRLINGEDSGSDLAQTKLDLPETLRVLEHALSQPAAVAGPANDLEELAMLNKLIELGAKASYAHAKSNSDDGPAGTAAYVQWQELRAEMGELIRAHVAPALEAPAAPTPVGEAGTMPGTSGFTMACFHADKVPLGTKLYTQPMAAAPQAPAALEELRKIAAIAACWGCDHPDAPGDTETVRRIKWAARQLRAAAQAPAAPAVDAETIEDAERFRAMANAALTDDEVFGRALDQHPDMGGDATIDDVRAMFDAARAAQTKEGGA